MPGSEGVDQSALPDDSPQVCGCFTRWVSGNLPPKDQQALLTDNGSAVGALQLGSHLGGLVTALQQCIIHHPPGGSAQTSTDEQTTTQAVQTNSTSEQMTSASTQAGTGTSASGSSTCAMPGVVDLTVTGTSCAVVRQIVNEAPHEVGCHVADEADEPTSGTCEVVVDNDRENPYTCSAKIANPPGQPTNGEEGSKFTCTNYEGSGLYWYFEV